MGVGINIENSLFRLIVALCDDYERRCALINSRLLPRRIDMELRYLNFKIYDATSEVVGESEAEKFINEIGKRIGYAKTNILDLSEAIYKKYKREVVENIARKMYLGG